MDDVLRVSSLFVGSVWVGVMVRGLTVQPVLSSRAWFGILFFFLLPDRGQTFAALPAHSSPLSKLESINLIETSLPLRAQQRSRIRERLRLSGKTVVDHKDEGTRGEGEVGLRFEEWIGKVPVGESFFLAHPISIGREFDKEWFGRWLVDVPEKDVFTMVVAHEFFDALPINLFQVSRRADRRACGVVRWDRDR